MSRRPHPLMLELVAARYRHKMTQQQVADRARLNRSLVAAWESGLKTPELPSLIAYARAVGCEISVVPAEREGLRRWERSVAS